MMNKSKMIYPKFMLMEYRKFARIFEEYLREFEGNQNGPANTVHHPNIKIGPTQPYTTVPFNI